MNIQEIRQKYPQYDSLDDHKLAKALHAKYYSQIPFLEFAGKIGLNAQPSAAEEAGPMDAFNVSIGRFLDRTLVKGPKQAYLGAKSLTGDGEASAELDRMKAEDAGNNKAFADLQEKHPFATFLGDVALRAGIPGGPLVQAGVAAMEYGTPKERAQSGGLAGAGAFAGRLLGGSVGPKSMAAEGANKWDIPLTRGQASGSQMAQNAEAVVEHLPFGGPVRKARDKTTEAFWRAVSNQFGENYSKLTPELLGQARDKIGGEIGRLASRNKINVDQDLFKGLQSAAARAQQELTEDEAKIVNGQIQQIWRAMDPATGTIPGTLYKAYQSKLGEIAKGRGGSVANVLGDVRAALREAMTRSVSPDDAQAWAKANEHYFNLQQVAAATKRTPGEMSPASLLAQVNQAQKSAKFGGGNDLAELAQFAQKHIGNKVPNSGTAQRLFWQQLLSGDAMSIPRAVGVAAMSPVTYGASRFLAGTPVSPTTLRILEAAGAGGLLSQFE